MYGNGSVYQKGRKWWISYSHDGKRVQRPTSATNRVNAELILTEIVEHLRDDYKTVNDLLDDLLRDYDLRGKKSIYKTESHMKALRRSLGSTLASKVTGEMIENYTYRRRHEGYANGTINRELQMLGQAFAPGAQQRLTGARHVVAERGAGAKRRRHGGEKRGFGTLIRV